MITFHLCEVKLRQLHTGCSLQAKMVGIDCVEDALLKLHHDSVTRDKCNVTRSPGPMTPAGWALAPATVLKAIYATMLQWM